MAIHSKVAAEFDTGRPVLRVLGRTSPLLVVPLLFSSYVCFVVYCHGGRANQEAIVDASHSCFEGKEKRSLPCSSDHHMDFGPPDSPHRPSRQKSPQFPSDVSIGENFPKARKALIHPSRRNLARVFSLFPLFI